MKTMTVFGAVFVAFCATWIPVDSLVTPEWYKIRHSYSGLCVAVGSYYDLLVLTNCQAASTWFQYSYQDYKLTDDKRRCILPIQLSDHHYYLQANNYCPDPSNSRYRQTVGKSMQHINSRKCFHPRDSPPIVGTSIILNPTCDTKWTEFILSSSSVTKVWYKIRHSYSGLCVAVGSYYDLLVLTNCQAASTWFQYSYQDYKLTDDKGRCILPILLSDNHYYLQANNYCPDPSNSRYRQTVGKSMQHINSRKCFHPRDSPPIVGTSIILSPTCDTIWTQFIFSPN